MSDGKQALIEIYARQLRIPTFGRYQNILRDAMQHGWNYEQFLCELNERRDSAKAREPTAPAGEGGDAADIQDRPVDTGRLSYLTLSNQQAELVFQALGDRIERASLIITTNLEFSRWAEVFGDSMMTAALVDRLTHKSYILDMNGESYRLRQRAEK